MLTLPNRKSRPDAHAKKATAPVDGRFQWAKVPRTTLNVRNVSAGVKQMGHR